MRYAQLLLLAGPVTIFGLLTAATRVSAQASCPRRAFPDASRPTAAVFVSYAPGRTDEAVTKIYEVLRERSPETQLFVLMAEDDRKSFKTLSASCAAPSSSDRWVCRVAGILADRLRVRVIPLEQRPAQVFPQDHLQFYVADGRPRLMPVVHPEDTLNDVDPTRPPRGIKTTDEIVARALGLPRDTLGPSTLGTEMTMGGNIESLPGNILVLGDPREERLPPRDEDLARKLLEVLSPEDRAKGRANLAQMITRARAAEATGDALVEYLEASGAALLRLDTKYLPVHHADEAFSVLRTNAPCGFSVLLPSPKLALRLLRTARSGDRKVCLRSRNPMVSFGADGAKIDAHVEAGCVGFRGDTAADLLADRKLVNLNLDLAAAMRTNRDRISRALARVCGNVDFVELPFLIRKIEARNEGVFPNPVNALVITPRRGFSSYLNNPTFVPEFDHLTIRELQRRGVNLSFVRSSAFFEGQGGLHCGSATLQTCAP